MADRPRIRKRMSAYHPMSREGYDGLRKYLKAAVEHDANPNAPAPDIELLRQGLPQGSILGITKDLGIEVKDTEVEDGRRTPRTLNPLGVALLRALLLPGGSVGLNRKRMHHPDRRDYLHYRSMYKGRDCKVPVLRIAADTPPGYQTTSADDHKSYCREDLPARRISSRQLTLNGTPTKSPYRGRELALRMAMHTFDKNKHKLPFDISRVEYLRMLRTILRLLDKTPLKAK